MWTLEGEGKVGRIIILQEWGHKKIEGAEDGSEGNPSNDVDCTTPSRHKSRPASSYDWWYWYVKPRHSWAPSYPLKEKDHSWIPSEHFKVKDDHWYCRIQCGSR